MKQLKTEMEKWKGDKKLIAQYGTETVRWVCKKDDKYTLLRGFMVGINPVVSVDYDNLTADELIQRILELSD